MSPVNTISESSMLHTPIQSSLASFQLRSTVAGLTAAAARLLAPMLLRLTDRNLAHVQPMRLADRMSQYRRPSTVYAATVYNYTDV